MAMVATAVAAAVTWVSSAAASAAALVATSMSVYGGISIGTAIGITNSLASLAASSLGSFALNAVFAPRVNAGGSPISFKADPSAPIRGIMGRFGTGGTQNHMRVWGKNNLFISYSVILSLGPIQGIEGFTAAKIPVNFTLAQGQAANVEPYKEKMWMTYKMGLPGDPALGPPVGISDGHVNPMNEWTVNHRTSGYAGAFWTMKNNSKRASYEGGVPLPNWTVLGQKVYDPRKDSTRTDIGGAGAHRWDDWRTWEYSNNAKIHGLNWCLGHHKKLADGTIDRTKLLAGVGASIDKIDLPTWVAGANVSDANGWTISGEWSTQDDKWQVLASMLQAGSAVPVHVGAKIGIMVNAPRASVATITRDDIIGKMNLKVMASRRDRFNTIFPRYINEQQGWEYSTAGAVTAAAYKAQDGGIERSKEMTYNYVDKSLQAGQLAAYDLANTRETLKVAFPAKPHLLGIKPGDAVTVYSEEHGLNNQKFIVIARPIELMEGTVGFELRSETDSKHAFALGQTDQPAPSPGLTGFATQPAPPEAAAWEVVPRPVEGGGVSQPGLIVGGDVPDGIGGILIEVSPQPIGPWTQVYDGPPTTEKVDITGLEAGGTYYVGLTHRSVRAGVPSERTVMGPFVAPLLVSNNSLEIGGRDATEVLAALDDVPGNIDDAIAQADDRLNLAVSNINLAFGELETATGILDDRIGSVELDIDDPVTGLKVRVGTNEIATDTLADRVQVVEISINTPDTGILARVAELDQAVIDLDLGKASASRVATVEARLYSNANLIPNPSGRDGLRGWAVGDAGWDWGSHPVWGHWISRQFTGAVGLYSTIATPLLPINQEAPYTISGSLYLNGLTAGSFLIHVPMYNAQGQYITEVNRYAVNGDSGAFDPMTFTPPVGVTQCRVYAYILNASGSATYAHAGFWGLKLERGTVATPFTDDASIAGINSKAAVQQLEIANINLLKADASRVETVEVQINTPTTGLLARTAELEDVTADLETNKASASRVAAIEVRGTGGNLLRRSQLFAAADASGFGAVNAGLPNFTWGVRVADGWAPKGEYALSLQGTPGGVNYAEVNGESIPVRTGDRLCFSCYHWGYYSQANLVFYMHDSNGNYVGFIDSPPYEGGNYGEQLANWHRAVCFGTVPAGAVTGFPVFRLFANPSAPGNPQALFLRPMLSIATPTQTQAPPWSPPSSERRATALEAATVSLEANKASSARVSALEVTLDTPGTGLLARAVELEEAVADLETGKASVTRVALLEAQGIVQQNLLLNPSGDAGLASWSTDYPPSDWFVTWDPTGSAKLFQCGVGATTGQRNFYQQVAIDGNRPLAFSFDYNGAGAAGTSGSVTMSISNGSVFVNQPLSTPLILDGTWRRATLLIPASVNAGGVYAYPGITASLVGAYIAMRRAKFEYGTVATAFTDDRTPQQLSARTGLLETATTNLQSGKAEASRVSLLEARAGGANLLTKSQFFASEQSTLPAPWTGGGYNGAANVAVVWQDTSWSPPGERSLAAWDTVPTITADGYYDFYSEAVPWEGSKRGVASVYSGFHRCNGRLIVAMLDGNFTTLAFADPNDVDASNNEVASGGTRLQDYKRLKVFFTPPDTCVYIRLLLRKGSTKAGETSSYAFWARPMLSEATPTQTEAPPWSPAALEARVKAAEVVSAGLNGKLLARWAQGTAVPGAATFIYAQSEVTPGAAPTSDVGIGAKTISLFNESGGIWTKALEISGGNAILRGGLQAGAFIRLGNGQGWPVALKAVDFNASDGEVVSFGTDLGALPSLSFALNNLAPLTAGETYDVKATNLTATGFTLSAKINVPATPSTQNATGANQATTLGGYPGQQLYLDGKPYAADGTYRIRANGYQRHNFQGTGGGQVMEGGQDEASISLQVWAYKASVWTFVANVYTYSVVNTGDYDSYQNGGQLNYQVDAPWDYDEVVTVGSGADYIGLVRVGSSNERVGAVYEISDVDWQSQGAGSGVRSATPNGQKTKITVRPQ